MDPKSIMVFFLETAAAIAVIAVIAAAGPAKAALTAGADTTDAHR